MRLNQVPETLGGGEVKSTTQDEIQTTVSEETSSTEDTVEAVSEDSEDEDSSMQDDVNTDISSENEDATDGDAETDVPVVDGDSSNEDSKEASSDENSSNDDSDSSQDNTDSGVEQNDTLDSNDTPDNTDTPDTEETNPDEATEGEDTDLDPEEEFGSEQSEYESLAEEELGVNSDEVIELSLDETNYLSLPGYNDYDEYIYNWYSFKAIDAGYYNFHIANYSSYYYSIDLYDNINGKYIDNISSYAPNSYFMEAEETVYIRAYSSTSEDNTVELDIKKIETYTSAIENGDGSYTFDTSDYTLTVLPKAGASSIRVEASLETGEETSLGSTCRLYGYIRRPGDDYDYGHSTVSLYKSSGYQSEFNISAQSDTEYELYFVLTDSSYNVLGLFDSDISLTTGSSDTPIAIYGITATESSITFDMEAMQYGYVYYAPTDESEDEKRTSINNGWYTYNITGLRLETEYYFQFTDNNGKLLYETTASTLPASTKAVYSAGLSEDNTTIALKADVSGYKGSASYAYLYYKYTDALGVEYSTYSSLYINGSNIVTDEDGAKSFTITQSLTLSTLAFEAAKEYGITMWVKIGSDDLTLPEETKTITTPEASFTENQLTFAVEEDGSVANRANYTVSVTDPGSSVYSIIAQIYYRQHGSKAGYSNTSAYLYNYSNYTATGYISNLQPGITYDFVVFVDGVKKEITKSIGTASVTLSEVQSEVNAFDLLRTYKLESAGTEALNSNYTLRLYYLNGSGYSSIGSAVTFNEDNSYQAEYKTSTSSSNKLQPDTDYDLKWELSNASGTIYTLYETVHTKEVSIAIEPAESSFSTQSYTVSLDPLEVANFDSFSLSLYLYIRKEGSKNYRNLNRSVSLSSSNEYSSTAAFTGLEEKTSYEVSLRDDKGLEYATASFTTSADERAVTITSVNPSLHSAYLYYSITGVTESMDGYVFFYIKEKDGEGDWERADYDSWYGETSSNFYVSRYNGVELKDGTTYEYQVGFGTDYNTPLSSLERIEVGTFSTSEDGRTLSNITVSPSYTTVDISAFFSGNESEQYSYIYFFYREKDNDAADWIRSSYSSTRQPTYNYSQKITGLTADVAYEYILVISDSYNCSSPDEVTKETRKAKGEFTTQKCNITLNFAAVDSKLTNDQAVISVTASGAKEERVRAKIYLSNDSSETVTLKSSDSYKGEVTFTGLTGETEYSITGAYISVLEGTGYADVGYFEYDYKFTTREAEVPASITLSADKIGLNALYAGYTGSDYEGYSYQILKASALPATAAQDFVWSSSDTSVVSVSANGKVSAKKAGTAVITAASQYDETVKAQCEVVVKEYVIGRDRGTDVEELDNTEFDMYYGLYKNSYTEGMTLYERSYDDLDGSYNMTLVSDYTVTEFNQSIAYWKDGNLYASNVGYTSFIFEKDSVKTRLNIYVTAEGKGFGITGISTAYDDYPAVKQSDGSYLLAYKEGYGIDYRFDIEVSPYKYEAERSDFNYSSSNTDIATVDEYGYIVPNKTGDVTITITPKNHYTINSMPYKSVEEVTISLHIKEVPNGGDSGIYALANIHKKIGSVSFPDNWGSGWSWKHPDTPLVTNGVYSSNSYNFEVVYKGEDYYPCEKTIAVYIGKITGVTVTDYTSSYNHVVEVGGDDKLVLGISPARQGAISSNDYEVDIPTVAGLTVTKNADTGYFEVTAQKKGSYTLKPVIKAKGTNTVFATTTYKITAVANKQAASIKLTTDTEGVTIDGNTIIFETVEARKDFTLNAEVTDRKGETITTDITWKTTDKTVATVTASKTDTHSAKVTAKADGHTVISATAKDAAGISAKVNLEVQNHSPRVDTKKVNVNIAYDYENGTGRSYAYNAGGAVEIIPVYGETLSQVDLRDRNAATASQNFKIESYSGYKYLVRPASENLTPRTYNCDIYVKTSAGNEYTYPLTVTVINKAPSVTAKMSTPVNLFYKKTSDTTSYGQYGQISFKVSGGSGTVTSITWDKASNDGFTVSSSYNRYYKGIYYAYVYQGSNLKVNNDKKLQDASVAKGTLTLKLTGYKKLYTFNGFAIKYNYKKPTLATISASSNVIPSVGRNTGSFYIYNKTTGYSMSYDTDSNYIYIHRYDEISFDSSDVIKPQISSGSSTIYFDYTGNAANKKLTMTLDSLAWREPLKVTHTVKTIKPTAYLSKGQMTFNTAALKSGSNTEVLLKNANRTNVTKDLIKTVKISGANAQSQKMLDEDLFIMESDSYNGITSISVEQSEAAFMNSSIPAGTYSYKVIPYYANPETGALTALNTVTLKIKVINKAITAKVSPKGKLDLAYGASYEPSEKKGYAVLVDPKFSNLPDGYYYDGYHDEDWDWYNDGPTLTGEYSKYFKINSGYIWYGNKYGYHYYITIDDNYYDDAIRKLKAGQSYKLAIEFTLSNYAGEALKVKSNTFTVKTKQSAPKVTVTNNSQTLYAAANGVYRYYTLTPPSGYSILSASGGIDCNKDGIYDISVSGGSSLTVRINDRDAVGATAKGKSYSIPVTVRLIGRDGIAKDVKVTIKVMVKR